MRYLTFILLLFSVSVYGQHTLQGNIVGEDNIALTGATVVLLSPQDSSMLSFAISDNDGVFYLEDVEAADYVLQITFVSYETFYKDIIVKGNLKKVDLGSFTLKVSSEILQEVTVTAEHIPMGIIGDTISYNASAFKTRPGATVEDLLKKLPGIDVQRDGSIKAMGEDVENVLVDGKEFFGDDPKIATQNLEAEAVDKVELFDKKSEIAEFTGIDDGAEEKTLNLKLKEDYKSGGFGNVELAGGTDSKYDGKINYNRFSPNMQAAAILSTNNINKQAFSFNEFIQFMGGLGNAISANNGMFNFGEFGRRMSPQGLRDNVSGGLNFNYDFSKKLKLTSHYFYSSTDQFLESEVMSNQFTDASDFVSINSGDSQRRNQNHRLTAKLDYKPTPFTQLIWKNNVYGILRDMETKGQTDFIQDNLITGETSRNYFNNSDQTGYEGSLQIRNKFKKKGRNWINTLRYQKGTLSDESDLLSTYLFVPQPLYSIDQRQLYNYSKNNLSLESAYTEPLGNKFYLGMNYAFNYDEESPEKKFYDRAKSDEVLNEELSSQYTKTNQINRGVLTLRKNAKKVKLNAGIGGQYSTILGELEKEATTVDNTYKHLLPSLSVNWELNREKSLDLSYRTSVNLPTLNQLAPLPDNSDPNLLILGNPDLAPEYVHRISFGYSSFDQFYFKNFYITTSIDLIENRIINDVTIDDQLLKKLQPVNTDLYTRISGHASYSAPLKPLGIKYYLSTMYIYSDYQSSINGQESGVKESNINLNFTLENRNKDHIDIATGIKMDHNLRRYTVNEDFNQTFFNYSLFIDANWYINDEWTISSSFDHITYSGEFFSESQQFNLWNASVRKSFWEDQFSVFVKVYDLLDQNQGIRRSGSINGLMEQRYNTLNRYFMAGIKYKLGKKKRKEAISFG